MIQLMKNNLNEIWTKQYDLGGNHIERQQIQLNNGLICFVGTISISGSRLFQIQINKGIPFEDNYLKRFHGVEVRMISGGNDFKYISIILSDTELLDVFSMFIEDLVEALEQLTDENEVPNCVNRKISNWARLFAKLSGQLLSREVQRGLFGELTILFDILKFSPDHVKCITSWTGPEGSNQDFSNDSTALEVKTTKATAPSVNISNELQLDWTVLSNLYLAVIHVDEINYGSDTLEKLIVQIKEQINNQPNLLLLFDDKLDRAGIQIGEETNYNKISYVIRSKKFYRIKDGFPVLINSTINESAIHNVKYQIDVSSIEDFETDFETIKKDFI